MASLTEKIQGLREAKAAFQALPTIVRDRLLDATFVTLSEIKRHAQAQLLASPSIQTRNLYNAVDFTLNKNSGRGRVGIANVMTVLNVGGLRLRGRGIIKAGAGGSALTSKGASKDVPRRRAHFIEFGTRHHPAEPFMTPAAESQVQPYLERCRARGPQIEQDAARIGGGARSI